LTENNSSNYFHVHIHFTALLAQSLCTNIYMLVEYWILVANYIRPSDVKSSRTSWPQGQNFVLGLSLNHLSLARPRTFYFGLMNWLSIV